MHANAVMLPTKNPLTADEIAHMSTEELNWEGAHFQHIVDRINLQRRQRIDAENARAVALAERRGYPAATRQWR